MIYSTVVTIVFLLGYKDSKSFTWDAYLRETNSVVAPARAFKQRSACGFKRGMKMEAVDKRVPQLIRVVTVEDVKDHMLVFPIYTHVLLSTFHGLIVWSLNRLKIRFDGWPENHAYWVDDDSPDIHPVGWCMKTGHPLEPPLSNQIFINMIFKLLKMILDSDCFSICSTR